MSSPQCHQGHSYLVAIVYVAFVAYLVAIVYHAFVAYLVMLLETL